MTVEAFDDKGNPLPARYVNGSQSSHRRVSQRVLAGRRRSRIRMFFVMWTVLVATFSSVVTSRCQASPSVSASGSISVTPRSKPKECLDIPENIGYKPTGPCANRAVQVALYDGEPDRHPYVITMESIGNFPYNAVDGIEIKIEHDAKPGSRRWNVSWKINPSKGEARVAFVRVEGSEGWRKVAEGPSMEVGDDWVSMTQQTLTVAFAVNS